MYDQEYYEVNEKDCCLSFGDNKFLNKVKKMSNGQFKESIGGIKGYEDENVTFQHYNSSKF